jgi:hypothetical protein
MKIDRAECMLILENKASHSHLMKVCQDINTKV